MTTEPTSGSEGAAAAPVPVRPNATEPSLAALVGGIVADAQNLLKQHLDLFHQEIQEDFRTTKEAVVSIRLLGFCSSFS